MHKQIEGMHMWRNKWTHAPCDHVHMQPVHFTFSSRCCRASQHGCQPNTASVATPQYTAQRCQCGLSETVRPMLIQHCTKLVDSGYQASIPPAACTSSACTWRPPIPQKLQTQHEPSCSNACVLLPLYQGLYMREHRDHALER